MSSIYIITCDNHTLELHNRCSEKTKREMIERKMNRGMRESGGGWGWEIGVNVNTSDNGEGLSMEANVEI